MSSHYPKCLEEQTNPNFGFYTLKQVSVDFTLLGPSKTLFWAKNPLNFPWSLYTTPKVLKKNSTLSWVNPFQPLFEWTYTSTNIGFLLGRLFLSNLISFIKAWQFSFCCCFTKNMKQELVKNSAYGSTPNPPLAPTLWVPPPPWAAWQPVQV